MKKYDVVIIGAGSGGLSAAAGAAKIGLKTLLIEKSKLGGDCLWHGCIPSKTLIHEADKMRVMREENVQVDFAGHFEESKRRIKMVQEAISSHDSEKRFNSLGVETRIGEAKFFKKNKIVIFTEGGKKEEYIKFKKCIIATGSRPMVPPVFNSTRYYTSENIFEIEKLPETMTVIGGGSVGVEIASAFAMFGTKIKVVLREDRIMPKEEANIGQFMKEKMHDDLEIEFYEISEVREVFDKNVKMHVNIGNGVILESEVLFVATGRQFNSDLDLANAKIEMDERRAIKINDYLQTTNRNVFAIGDVNGFRLFTHAAGYQAKAAIQNMIVPGIFGFMKKKSIPLGFPWVTYTYPEVAHVGMYKKELDEKKFQYKSYTTNLESVDRAKTSKVSRDGFIEVIVGKKGKILGVTIVAPHAGELITEWVLAIENNLPVDAIFNTVHAYPTLSELNPRSTFEYMNEKLTPFKSRLLRLLFKF
jgi:pyruvate/2-oxoglutarate dehydrogenase complex dihydrolipoamide dehydrogenase (E3) component